MAKSQGRGRFVPDYHKMRIPLLGFKEATILQGWVSCCSRRQEVLLGGICHAWAFCSIFPGRAWALGTLGLLMCIFSTSKQREC